MGLRWTVLALAVAACTHTGAPGTGESPRTWAPYPQVAQPCLAAIRGLQLTGFDATAGASEGAGGCVVRVVFESEREMQRYVASRQERGLPVDTADTDFEPGPAAVPLQLEVVR